MSLLLLGVGLLAGCAAVSAGAGGPQAAALSTPFTLAEGESAVVGGEKVGVTFEKLLSESRCPADVQCIQAGEATIRVQVQPADGAKTALTLSTRQDGSTGTVGRLTVTLTGLRPVPRVKTPPKDERYRATLVVDARE